MKEIKEEGGFDTLKKKEIARYNREIEKKDRYLGGVCEMRETPDIVIIVDIHKERIALKEAKKLNIPVVALVDTNSNPELVDYPIPVNDDSSQSIGLIAKLIGSAISKASVIYEKKRKAIERKEAEAQAKIIEKKREARKVKEAEKKEKSKEKKNEEGEKEEKTDDSKEKNKDKEKGKEKSSDKAKTKKDKELKKSSKKETKSVKKENPEKKTSEKQEKEKK